MSGRERRGVGATRSEDAARDAMAAPVAHAAKDEGAVRAASAVNGAAAARGAGCAQAADAAWGARSARPSLHEVLGRLAPRGADGTARLVFAVGCLVLLVLTFIVPTHDVMATDVLNTFAAPSADHPLGTDNLGRDVFALMVHGCWRTLVVIGLSSAISFVGGVALGLLAGWCGGAVEAAVTLAADLTLVVPSFILALIFSGIFGLTPLGAGVVLGIGNLGDYAVQATALTKQLLAEDYIVAEGVLGIPSRIVAVRHLLPGIVRPLSTYLASRASNATLQYASLAYIGLGSDISNPDWGTMLYQYRSFILTNPMLVIMPMLGVGLVALLCHVLLDGGESHE